METTDQHKPLYWMASAKKDLRTFPPEVQDVMGFALHQAQAGGKSDEAKPLKGYRGAGVLEVVDDFDGDTYRTVYTVRFKKAVYVLHAFQKKSKSGNSTPKSDLELVQTRLKQAETHHQTL